jgi:Multiubiquitin
MVTDNLPGADRPGDPVERAIEHLHQAEHDLERAREEEHLAEDEVREATEELEEAEHPRETEIIVNSRPRKVSGHEVTYEEVLELAFPGPHNDPNVVFSMTYRHAAAHPSAGELGPGGKVKVREGTVFNVTRTVKS